MLQSEVLLTHEVSICMVVGPKIIETTFQ